MDDLTQNELFTKEIDIDSLSSVSLEECKAYLKEEIRQINIMLGGILSNDYKQYILRKKSMYEIFLQLVEEKENELLATNISSKQR